MRGSQDSTSKNISSWLKTITLINIKIVARSKGGIISQI